jgi:adenosylhomocysteine nucleosidase
MMPSQGEDRDVGQPSESAGRIFVQTAMAEEAAALGDDFGCLTWMRAAGARFAVGSGPYSAVAVGISGMGKVAAAIAAQYACDRWRPWLLMMSGVAGGLQPDARVGDLVVPSEAIQHDFDARPIAASRSLIPHLGTSALESDHRVSAIVASACEHYLASAAGSQLRDVGLRRDTGRVIRGAALTGDQVIAAGPVKDELVSAFPAGVCADMETAAVAQVARQNGLAWAAVRMISDTAEAVDAGAVLAYLASGGAKALSSILRETIDRLLNREPQVLSCQT